MLKKRALLVLVLLAGSAVGPAHSQTVPEPCYHLQLRRKTRIGSIADVKNLGDRVAGQPTAADERLPSADPVASPELVSIIGGQLQADTMGNTTAEGSEWPNRLAGVELLVGGRAAPLYYVGLRRGVRVPGADTEIIAQLPKLSGPSAILQVRQARMDGRYCIGPELVIPVADSALSLVRDGDGNVFVENGTKDRFTFYAFGLGDLVGDVEPGRAVVTPLWVTSIPAALVQGQVAAVSYAGAVPGLIGVYQINVQAPPYASGRGFPPEVAVTQGSRRVVFYLATPEEIRRKHVGNPR